MRATVIILSLAACSSRSTPDVESGPFDPEAAVTRDDDSTRISVHRKDVPLEQMPIVAETLGGLPMSGLANATIDLTVPREGGQLRYRKLAGTIAVSCPAGCALGDSRATLAVAGAAIQFGKVDLGAIDFRAEAKNGAFDVTVLDIVSSDVEVHGRMHVDLADDLGASPVDGCIWFKEKEGLVARDPKTAAVLQTTGATRNRDGFFSIKLSGRIGALKRLALDCVAPASSST